LYWKWLIILTETGNSIGVLHQYLAHGNLGYSEEEKNMKVGEMWKINNGNKSHAVYNNSDEDRVHLIFDYIIYRNSYDQTGHEQWY